MKDQNLVRLTGTIFWSKLDDRQTYTILRLGVKLANGGSVFVTVNNPNTKAYDLIKAGNKILVSSGYMDTWEKEDGTSEVQIKANDAGVQFFPKEKALGELNNVAIIGRVTAFSEDTATIEMVGDRNPKTDKPSLRKVKVKIGDTYKDIVGNKIMVDAVVNAVDVGGKSKLTVEADFNKINVL